MKKERLFKLAETWDWANIDQVYHRSIEDGGVWEPDDYQQAKEEAFKAKLRRAMREAKDANGQPRFASIEREDELGSAERIYKQESLFDAGDYMQTVNYHGKLSRHHWKEMQRYRGNCEKRHGVQLPLPWFPEDELDAG